MHRHFEMGSPNDLSWFGSSGGLQGVSGMGVLGAGAVVLFLVLVLVAAVVMLASAAVAVSVAAAVVANDFAVEHPGSSAMLMLKVG